ncbi:PREDICTED: uncharacterized protein LOC109339380 isoform X1 [Lupinus angustifolius]|nr:PREDICTED: uncharacterized protein LOC109339380 isoform X1 [Lupinus angustifolius]
MAESDYHHNSTTRTSIMEWKQMHPLHQIAETPTHKLLLKQWLKEQELIHGRIALKETQIDSIRKEITLLYIFFFLFHSTTLMLLFNNSNFSSSSSICHRSWVPSLCSLVFSLGIIWGVRYKGEVEGHMEKMLKREKEDKGLLGKCVEELKKKGLEFDLLKEVDALRRAKSLRVVEGKEGGGVKKWSSRDFVSLFFFSMTCLSIVLTRIILCT